MVLTGEHPPSWVNERGRKEFLQPDLEPVAVSSASTSISSGGYGLRAPWGTVTDARDTPPGCI